MSKKRVLIVYYSFSGQTQLLIQRLVAGLKEEEIEVNLERLQPVQPIQFPLPSVIQLLKILIFSFFRWRVEVKRSPGLTIHNTDLVIIGGPTWSYNPSGPVLDFLDTNGEEICGGPPVLPLISCRSYWFTHYHGLKYILRKKGARVLKPLIFLHTASEPWRTIGVLLQAAGKLPRRESSWFRRHYVRYGHSRQQYDEALEEGRRIGVMLKAGKI